MITSFKIFENVQISKKILNDLNIPLDDERYIELKDLLKNNTGYLGQFTKWLFIDKFEMDELINLYNQLKINKLNKPISEFETPEKVIDYINLKDKDTKLNQVLKSLPSRSRQLVNTKLKDLILNNIEYYKSVKDFYSKKGGRYKDTQTLYRDTKSLITNLKGEWNADSIKYNDDELIYEDDSTLILNINNYNRSCDLGSKSWCISYDEYYWNNYSKDFNKQYFIYDFSKDISDKKSMIGVTIKPNGNIYTAHYKDDSECPFEYLNIYRQYLKPTSKEYIKSNIDLTKYKNLIKYGFIKEFKELLKKGFDPSDVDNYAIKYASRNGHLEVVKLLLKDKRVDPSDDNNYAIGFASQNGHLEVVKLLLKDKRVDPSDDNNYAIQWASEKGHSEVVKLLLNDKRVRDKLTSDEIRKYSKNI